VSIVNRRNAILGWGMWKMGKVAAKRKAKQAVRPSSSQGRKGKGAMVSTLAAAGGALWFWRRRRSDGEGPSS